jgi:hypothetical protein
MGRWPIVVGAALALAAAWPMIRTDGVDVPDDALYYAVASWEWLALAWGEGIFPWFVPGKLGGVSLFGDAMPMGPFYLSVPKTPSERSGSARDFAAR